MERDYQYLIVEYRKIWNNRELPSDGKDEEVLKGAILRDLYDENSHPRARKTLHEKFSIATKRIIDSSLSSDDKIELIDLHLELLQPKSK